MPSNLFKDEKIELKRVCHSIQILSPNSETPPWGTIIYRIKPWLPGKASQLCTIWPQAGIISNASRHMTPHHCQITPPPTSPCSFVLFSAWDACFSYLLVEILQLFLPSPLIYWVTYSVPQTLLGDRNEEREMTSPDLTGVEVEEIDFSTKALQKQGCNRFCWKRHKGG